ncbi:uncharacterized protein TNCV_342191 [Trichonephila clavipes]|nr:uncharacterized protein TNCV_342191 [Trichonephila clavipes]
MNILCLVSPVKVGGKPGLPVTVGGIPFPDRIPEKKIVDTKEDRSPVSCYGCGAPGIIRSRCHTCNPVRQKDDALSSSLNQSNFYSFSSKSNPISIIQISICNTEAAVCADTGATHSVAGEKLYHLLKQKRIEF